jgi:hypothetical protein
MTLTIPSNIRRNTSAEPADHLARDAGLLLDATGIVRSRAWISRAVRAYLDAPLRVPFGLYLVTRIELNDFQRKALAERADLRYLLTYADPTGEAAIRNVTREQRS